MPTPIDGSHQQHRVRRVLPERTHGASLRSTQDPAPANTQFVIARLVLEFRAEMPLARHRRSRNARGANWAILDHIRASARCRRTLRRSGCADGYNLAQTGSITHGDRVGTKSICSATISNAYTSSRMCTFSCRSILASAPPILLKPLQPPIEIIVTCSPCRRLPHRTHRLRMRPWRPVRRSAAFRVQRRANHAR